MAKYSGGNGLTLETAVIINVENQWDGVPAEGEYLSQKYGERDVEWFKIEQQLIRNLTGVYDKVIIDLKSGQQFAVFFDISSFFGKF